MHRRGLGLGQPVHVDPRPQRHPVLGIPVTRDRVRYIHGEKVSFNFITHGSWRGNGLWLCRNILDNSGVFMDVYTGIQRWGSETLFMDVITEPEIPETS
jgi:hypothetical protein